MNVKKVHIYYYAVLREQRGLNQETLETKAVTAQDLYEELKSKFHFKFPSNLLKIAINNEFVDWATPLKSGDSIVFIPPVAGG